MAEIVQTLAEQDRRAWPSSLSVSARPSVAIRAASLRSMPRTTPASITTQSQTGAMGTFDYLVAHSDRGRPPARSSTFPVARRTPGGSCSRSSPSWSTSTTWVAPTAIEGPLGILERDSAARHRHQVRRHGRGLDAPSALRVRHADPRSVLRRATATTLAASLLPSPAIPAVCRRSDARAPARLPVRYARLERPAAPEPDDAGTTTLAPPTRTTPAAPAAVTARAAGHPCMGCTEKGYPDSFVPFVVRS